MATQQLRHKGVTPPISTTMPTPAEKAENDALIDELKRQNNFEAGEETERRYAHGVIPSTAPTLIDRLSAERKCYRPY